MKISGSKVVQLSVHRNTKERRERHYCRDRLRAVVREVPADADGFALVWYRRNRNGESAEVCATWSVRDPLDVHALPELARTELYAQIVRQSQ